MKPRILADVARIALVSAAALAAVGSASSTSQTSPPPTPYGAHGTPPPPPPQAMEPTRATGLWKSSFGAVKVEEDQRSGAGALQGVWVYDRNGQEVIGYFAGRMNGNVLQFTWQEPAQPAPLQGAGYLVFDPAGQRFSGRWWTNSRDRQGEWSGWRAPPTGAAPAPDGPPPPPPY